MHIPFNKPHMTGKEADNIAQAHAAGHLSGDGRFTRSCNAWLEHNTGARKALLTHSCTGALEIAAILAGIRPGDEVIMPSYTFVSTANAFVLRGAVPVFIDIRPDTLNLDERLIASAVTNRTRVIVPVHYAGVACEMDTIISVAHEHGLIVVEDAAQAVLSTYRGRPLGAIGHLGALSFHETKNIISGEGGALLVRDPDLMERAEIIREKGTDRARFFRGAVDKYTWVDVGSSYLPGEIVAAFLWAQIQESSAITRRRLAQWDRYHAAFAGAEMSGRLRRPMVPPHCSHNAHMYYLILTDMADRARFIGRLKNIGIHCVSHYVPLHSSPAGLRYSRAHGAMTVTDDLSDRLVRLPLWIGLEEHQDSVIEEVLKALKD